ncbi:MAG: enoyl-CoA hydratase [Actinomycetota bacterium]|nr:enoyl-CoA hydratase [Actinomycetota bacterium]
MSFVRVEKPRPHVCLVTLDRPERMNAMAFDVMVPLRETLESIAVDNDVRVIVLTGAGKGFCSGADLVDAGYPPGIDGLALPSIGRRSMKLLEDVVTTVRELPQPVIAAVNGAAIGGGFCLAVCADIRVASTEAYFRAAGINNGLTASELGLSYLLPRAIGSSRASEIMLTGRDVRADEAAAMGLVSKVVEPDALLEECYEMAARIVGFSHVGVQLTKQTLRSSLEATSFGGHMEHEGLAQLYVRLLTKNFEEAILARREGRAPEFLD